MGESEDRGERRTRPFYVDVIDTLNMAKIRYTVVGGVATILHGAPRMTGDLDLAPLLDRENLLALVDALEGLGYKPRLPVNPRDLAIPEVRASWMREKGMKVFAFFHPKRPFAEVDILVVQEMDREGIYKRRVEYRAGDVIVPTASIDDLISMKSLSGRDKDLADISALTKIKTWKGQEGLKRD